MPEYRADRAAVGIIFKKLAATRALKKDFPAGSTTVFRLVLPPDASVCVEYAGGTQEPRRYRRDRLTLYWVDSNPLALLEKPLALFVFKGTRLHAWEQLSLPVMVAGRRVPATRHDPSFEIPVGNAENYFRRLRAFDAALLGLNIHAVPRAPPGIAATLAPLTFPLPPTDLPGGGTAANEAGTTGGGPAAVGTNGQPCTPVNFVTCLLMQGKPEEGQEPVTEEARALVGAFGTRGYATGGTETGGIIRARDAARPVEQMLDDLLKVIPAKFCECPTDQLVIVIAAHQGADRDDHIHTSNPNARVSYYIEPLDGKDIIWMTHARFAELLAAALAKKNIDPRKLFLVIFGCYSGDALDRDRYGKHLPGALVTTSSPDRRTTSYTGVFRTLVKHCLDQPAVRSWAEFIACLKRTAGGLQIPDPEDKDHKKKIPAPVPGAGRPAP